MALHIASRKQRPPSFSNKDYVISVILTLETEC